MSQEWSWGSPAGLAPFHQGRQSLIDHYLASAWLSVVRESLLAHKAAKTLCHMGLSGGVAESLTERDFQKVGEVWYD